MTVIKIMRSSAVYSSGVAAPSTARGVCFHTHVAF